MISVRVLGRPGARRRRSAAAKRKRPAATWRRGAARKAGSGRSVRRTAGRFRVSAGRRKAGSRGRGTGKIGRRIAGLRKRRRQLARTVVDPEGQPVGLWESTRDYVRTVHGERFADYYQEHYHGDFTELSDSLGLDGQVHGNLRAGRVHGHPAFTALIEGARVWEKNGAVIAPDNKLLADVSWDYLGDRVYGWDHPVFRQWRQPPLAHIPETAGLLTFIWSGNYFHWLYDVLPRVDLLRRSGIPIGKYIVPRDELQFQDDTLNLLGIPKEMRIEIDHDFHARIDRLVVPSFVRGLTDHPSEYPKWATDFLRYEFLYTKDVPVSGEFERIYVSRARAWQRRILNEDQVQQTLQERGFRTVFLEQTPFMEQVRIFASARAIVAPHGAGLANLAFCAPGTKVIEMLPPNYVSNYFWHLSNQVGLQHYHLLGESYVKPREDWWDGSADFTVDADKLRRLLDMAGV
jgi:capsular polysaccharide biosynthesis protein